jgi:hypothetical protein
LKFVLPNKYSATFKVLSAVFMKIYVVWYVTPCRVVYRYRRFGDDPRLQLDDGPRRVNHLEGGERKHLPNICTYISMKGSHTPEEGNLNMKAEKTKPNSVELHFF